MRILINKFFKYFLSRFFSYGRYNEYSWQEFFKRTSAYLPRDSYLGLLFQYFIWQEFPAKSVSLTLSTKRLHAIKRIDPWLHNLILCDQEMLRGVGVVKSKPWNLALPIADLCNARCSFCVSWLRGGKTLKVEDLNVYSEIVPYAKQVGLQGLGEPLANPDFDEIMRILVQQTDRRATFYLITNGVFVPRHPSSLSMAPINRFNISLNAATSDTHNVVMGLGEQGFSKAISGVKKLLEIRNSKKGVLVIISMVLTSENFHEVEEFIELGNNLGVDQIVLRSLMPINDYLPGLNYHLLPPILLPNFSALKEQAINAISNSKIAVVANIESWDVDPRPSHIDTARIPFISRDDAIENNLRPDETRLADKSFFGKQLDNFDLDSNFNPYKRNSPLICDFPYQQYVSTQLNGRLVPCCYMTDVPNHEPIQITDQLEQSWNSEAMVNLRLSLSVGPLLMECRRCPLVKNSAT